MHKNLQEGQENVELNQMKFQFLFCGMAQGVSSGRRLLSTFSKKKQNKKVLFSFGFLLFSPLFVKAVCPVCAVVAAGGLGLSRWLGIDDTISGTLIGGILMSLVIWTIEWLDKRKIRFLFRKPLILLFWYTITIWPLLSFGIVGQEKNKFLGIDKLIFGIIFGSIFFLFGFFVDIFLKKKNCQRAYFPFQKVVIPILFLVILSFILYFLTS